VIFYDQVEIKDRARRRYAWALWGLVAGVVFGLYLGVTLHRFLARPDAVAAPHTTPAAQAQ